MISVPIAYPFAGHLMYLGFFLHVEAQEHQPLRGGYIKATKL